MLAQLTAVFLGGGVLGLVGAALTASAVAVSLRATDYTFMVSTGDVTQVLAASAFAGGAGAVLGAGIGALVRNTGGAVTGAVLLLIVAPPLIVQLVSDAASWVPNVLANVLPGTATDVAVPAALAALALWALIPAMVGLTTVHRRDVV